MKPLVINFGHPLNEASLQYLQANIGAYNYVHQKIHVDFCSNLLEQVVRYVDQASKCFDLEEAARIYLILPSLPSPAVLIAMEIAARTGEFPSVLLLKHDLVNGGYRIYDTVDALKLKHQARDRRKVHTLNSH